MPKILVSAAEIERELLRLMDAHEQFDWAVAWATTGSRAAKTLRRHSDKIHRLAIGTHFHQTDPAFMAPFVGDKRVSFVLNPKGVFHPKLYAFSSGGRREAVIGSANFTNGGMSSNSEVAVLLSDSDFDSGAWGSLLGVVNEAWKEGDVLTDEVLAGYRVLWQRSQRRLARLAGMFATDDARGGKADDGGRAPLEIQVLRMSWADFIRRVQSDDHHSFGGRRKILGSFREWFASGDPFSSFSLRDRQRVAGTTSEGSMEAGWDWRWFGSMTGSGVFQKLVNENSAELSAALDEIPSQGLVTRANYDEFVRRFRMAFTGESRQGRVPTASRLLAMKRPDVFVCASSKNRKKLCNAFKIPESRLAEDFSLYWTGVIARIQESAWWETPEPVDSVERDIWLGRAAFLDALYYVEDE